MYSKTRWQMRRVKGCITVRVSKGMCEKKTETKEVKHREVRLLLIGDKTVITSRRRGKRVVREETGRQKQLSLTTWKDALTWGRLREYKIH